MLRVDCCCSAAAVFAMVWRRCGGEYCGLCFRRACLRARGVRSPRHCALTAQALRRLGSASRRCASRLSRSICVRSWPRCLRSTSGGWSRCPGGARCLCEGCDPASPNNCSRGTVGVDTAADLRPKPWQLCQAPARASWPAPSSSAWRAGGASALCAGGCLGQASGVSSVILGDARCLTERICCLAACRCVVLAISRRGVASG